MEQVMKGGYRLNGQAPEQVAGKPLVSVITVVFNSVNLLEQTIQSVLNQTWPDIEYIIIDGGSKDGTVDIIRKYERKIAYWVSEPDGGLYDAMNKGLAAATGDFVWFLNSGDLAYREDTLEQIFKDQRLKNEEQRSDDQDTRPKINDLSPNIQNPKSNIQNLIYYGDTMVVDSHYHEVGIRRLRPPEVLNWKSFRKGMLVCHQAILVSRSIAEPFDLKYKHSADFDWVIRALRKASGKGERRKEKGERKSQFTSSHLNTSTSQPPQPPQPLQPFQPFQPIVNTHQILCSFLDGGHSKQNIPASLRERFDIMRRNYGLIPTVLRHFLIAIRFGLYYLWNKRF
ncbi:MAG: glycosyltransferase family 2 protein [Bacteroidota bacterium]